MTTDEAFKKMINTPKIFKVLEMKADSLYSIRHHFNNGSQFISLDKKISLLQKAGYKMMQDIVWKQP